MCLYVYFQSIILYCIYFLCCCVVCALCAGMSRALKKWWNMKMLIQTTWKMLKGNVCQFMVVSKFSSAYLSCAVARLLLYQSGVQYGTADNASVGWSMSLLQLLVATTRNYALQQRHSNFPSLLWHCWLGNRNGIQPAKSYTSDPQRFFIDDLCTWPWVISWKIDNLKKKVALSVLVVVTCEIVNWWIFRVWVGCQCLLVWLDPVTSYEIDHRF